MQQISVKHGETKERQPDPDDSGREGPVTLARRDGADGGTRHQECAGATSAKAPT